MPASLQVWLAALVPSREASLIEELATHAHEAFNPNWIGVNPIGDPDVAREFLFHDCDDETFAWAMTTQRDFLPRAVYEERIPLYDSTPSVYIVARRDGRSVPSGSGA